MGFKHILGAFGIASLLVSVAPVAQAQDRMMMREHSMRHHMMMRHHDRMMRHERRMMRHERRMMHHRMHHRRMMERM